MTQEIQIVIYIVGWVFYVIAQSFVINGIKIAATGTTEIMPNGKERDTPMILYPIAKWLDQSKTVKVFYEGGEFLKLMKKLVRQFRGIIPATERVEDGTMYFNNDKAIDLMIGVAAKLKVEDIEMEIRDELGGRAVRFYKEYKEYRFSKYIRMPTFGCIRCMSSFWSIFTFWLPMLLVFGYDHSLWLLWLANIPAVTFTNTYIAQRYT